ncbi:ShlB/FhaC/HecB family hemolysin secretion/activation protein [Aquicella lusitana]|uniref:Hemolysin activation/secretion protein n=1 Tax=Aquicella lusitana TaxID=254246 RepID=A0A370G8C2_9COXI|nr:ShlB/FhaC/HecB family hemolysin secretion/activation protein [Aquicella lusitana]RDI40052.1 hemolysin activation/secretion protein [Aquicella lusitana]VVC72333.1 Heme/hemopexin transporter protein HuxB [Aquicella lusitana]
MRSIPFKLVGIVSLIVLAGKAWSVGGESIPASAKPETVSRALTEEQPAAPARGAPPVLEPAEKAPSPLGAEAEKIKFQLNGVILDGNRVFSDQQLKLLYQDKIGKTISVAELFNIVQSITNFYRNNGYIISRAILPPQHVKNGVVRIQIIEGFIDKVDVAGNPRGAKCLVKAYGENIRACPPLAIKRMEKYLLLANEIPGTTVRAVLSPSKTTTGAADLSLVTENKPIGGYVSYDNYGTRYIGPQQMTGNIALNSMIASGDATQFTYTKTPKGKELTYTDLNYNLPVGDEGIRGLFGYTRAGTHPLFVLQPSQIDGLTNNYYTTFQFPMIRTRTESFTFRTGFNYLDSRVTTFDEPLYADHLRNLDLGFSYNFADRFYGANLISADLRQGLPILGYTSDTNVATAETSRPGGRGAYTKIMLQLSRLQAVKGPFSVYGIFSGQWAFNPLLSSEQFTFGGPILGRGYDVAELIGDRGVAGSLEARYDLAITRLLTNLQIYIFYDAGMIWNMLNIEGTPRKQSATSTGIGTRFFITKYISGNLMWTQTLTKEVAAEELIGQGRRPRVFFSLVASLN